MADHSKRIFDNKRFFYIALAVCMLALGSASASALKSYRDVQKEETSLAASVPDSAPDAKKANEPLTDVPYSEAESAVVGGGKHLRAYFSGSKRAMLYFAGGREDIKGFRRPKSSVFRNL